MIVMESKVSGYREAMKWDIKAKELQEEIKKEISLRQRRNDGDSGEMCKIAWVNNMSDDKWVWKWPVDPDEDWARFKEWERREEKRMKEARKDDIFPIIFPSKKIRIKDIVLFRLNIDDKLSATVTFLEFRRSAMENRNGLARYFYDKKPDGHYDHHSSESFKISNDYASIINWLKKDGYKADEESLMNIGDGRVVTFVLHEEICNE